jgi:tetratricopeptide (TPR) repeat protein
MTILYGAFLPILRRCAPAALGVILAMVMAVAAQADDGDRKRYAECIALAESDAERAFDSAMVWRDEGGGVPARHCAAVALFAMGQYAEAASRLDDAATRPGGTGAQLRAEMLNQAGEAWLLAGEPQRARHSLNTALTLEGLPATLRGRLHYDRARSLMALGDFDGALADLDASIRLATPGSELYVLRAMANRAMDRLSSAVDDAERAVALDRRNPAAWLERGLAREGLGHVREAREAFLETVRLTGEADPLGHEAQDGLARLALQPE